VASDIAVLIELSIDFVSNVDIMLTNSGFKIAFFMTIVKSNLLTIVSKLVCTTVVCFKMATPSNVNKTINDEKITPDAKRVNLFSRETFPQPFK
jgi:hypothetical protein